MSEMDKRNEKMVAEMRAKHGENVEIRTHEIRAHESENMVVEGYASVFDSVYNIGFDETVDRGAFDNVLDNDVRFFFDHGGTPLARTTNGTLKLSVDDVGLHYRAELSDTSAGRDLFVAIQRGDVSQSSFAFTIDKETRDSNGVRHIQSVRQLLDVAAVSFPASPATAVRPAMEARNNDENKNFAHKLPPKPSNMEMSKMTVSDLRAKRGQLADEFAALGTGIETENRAATEAESDQLERLDSEISKIDGFIERREKQAAQIARMANAGTTSTSERKEIREVNKRFSLSRAIAHVANGRPLMGAELEWSMESQTEAQRSGLQMQGQIGIPTFAMETRANETDQFAATSNAAGDAGGMGFVPEVVPAAIDALHQPSFIETLGVQFLNATGNVSMPRVATRPNAASKTETEAAAVSGMQLDEVDLVPNRYTAETKYSKQLLLQGTSQVDQFIARQIIDAHNRQIDNVALKILTDAATAQIANPSAHGLAYVDGATPGVLDEDILFAMESALVTSDTDFGNVRIVAGPRALQRIRSFAATGAGGDAMYNGTSLMGYALTKSGRIVEAAGACTLAVGNWGQSLIGAKFGPLDVLVDPYSAASNAQIKLHTNQWFDVALRQDGAMAVSNTATLAAS